MKLMFETEYWREQLLTYISDLEAETGVTLDTHRYDDIAKELRSRVKDRLFFDHDIEVTWSYQQSVGAFVLVQSGTEQEMRALDRAFGMEEEWVWGQVRKEIDAERAAMAAGGE